MLPFELTKDTPYLALSGELWSVFYEYFTEIDRVIKGFYCMRNLCLVIKYQPSCVVTFWPCKMADTWCNLTHWSLGDVVVKFKRVTFECTLWINFKSTYCEIALSWILKNTSDDKLTLASVMAWCPQATSHYLSQCWPRYLSPYGTTRPQWVKAAAVRGPF